MPRQLSVTRLLVVAALALAVVVQAVPAAKGAPAILLCKSGDLRYPFQAGGPKDFGVFKLSVSGGRCTTAHRVAKTWMKRFETALRAGHVRLPHSVDGFTFKTLPAHAAQTYRERGRRGATTIRFDYRVPNG
jgi:hypothetical protein